MHREFQKTLFQNGMQQTQFVEEKKHSEAKQAETPKVATDDIKIIQEQIYKLSNHVNEQIKSQFLKLEKLAQALHRLELSHSGMVHETAEKMAQLSGRVSERKAVDFRIQELIDRQNTVLQTYEVRLANLQKVINEKEAAILSLKAHLNDAKADLMRLKR